GPPGRPETAVRPRPCLHLAADRRCSDSCPGPECPAWPACCRFARASGLASLLALACRRAVVGLARQHDWSLTRSFLLASRLWRGLRWIGRFGFGRFLSLLRIVLLGLRWAGVALVRLFLFVGLLGRVHVLAGDRVLGRRAIGLGGLPIGFPLLRLILPLGLGASILLVRLGIRGVF